MDLRPLRALVLGPPMDSCQPEVPGKNSGLIWPLYILIFRAVGEGGLKPHRVSMVVSGTDEAKRIEVDKQR